jgi:hypothetical protein
MENTPLTGKENCPQTAHGYAIRDTCKKWGIGRHKPETETVIGDGLTNPFDEEATIEGNGRVTNTKSSIAKTGPEPQVEFVN